MPTTGECMITFSHVTKMAVTPVVPTDVTEKTSCWTETARLCILSKFYIVEIWILSLFYSCDLDLDPMTFKVNPYSVMIYHM